MNDNLERRNLIIQSLRNCIGNRQLIELRCIGENFSKTGLFDSLEQLAEVAIVENDNGANCYYTLNRIEVAPSRVTNDLGSQALTTNEVSRLESLLIDIDTKRQGNGPATEGEKDNARLILKEVLGLLGHEMWPKPVVVDSGNGFHVILRTDLDPHESATIKKLLSSLAQLFDNTGARIDTSVHDPIRVCRIPGTYNRKGTPSCELPHRMAIQIGSNAIDECVTKPQIDRLLQKNLGRLWLRQEQPDLGSESNGKALFSPCKTLAQKFELPAASIVDIIQEYCDQSGIDVIVRRLADAAKWGCKKALEAPDPKTQFDQEITEPNEEKPKCKQSMSEKLVELVLREQKFYRTTEGETFAAIPLPNGGVMNLETSSIEYKNRLTTRYYEVFEKIPQSNMLTSAIDTINGFALMRGQARETSLRIASHEDKYYLDIGDDDWNCVEIDSAGWRLRHDPPVLFRRTCGYMPLPIPPKNGSIGPLIECLNLGCFEHFLLICGVLLVSLHPDAEYPVLVLYGEQGTSKSTTAKVIRSLIDPNLAPLRANPRNDDDFANAGYNNHVVVFDNLSFINEVLSDNLCRMSTGASLSKRRQYTNRDEVLVHYRNPVVINGITDLARRPDLLNRCIIVDLQKIVVRISSAEFWTRFDTLAPTILGGLLDAVSFALREPTASDLALPRMAEFCRFVMSAEPELARQWNKYAQEKDETERWEVGNFYSAYMENIDQATLTASEQIPYLRFLDSLLKRGWGQIQGSATEILKSLRHEANGVGVEHGRDSGWPQTASALGTMLQRQIPILRENKIEARRERKPGGNREREWIFTRIKDTDTGADGTTGTEPTKPLVPTQDA